MDVDVELPTLKASIEDRLIYELVELNRRAPGAIAPTKTATEELNRDPEPLGNGVVPVARNHAGTDESESAPPLSLRSVRVSPFTVVTNARWSSACFVSLMGARLRFSEFRRNHANLRQIGHAAPTHYAYGHPVRNAVAALVSLEQIGAPINLMTFLWVGVQDVIRMPARAVRRGPFAVLTGLFSGLVSFARHLYVGLLVTVLSFTSSWSKTLDGIAIIRYAARPVVVALKAMGSACKTGISYVLSTDGAEEDVD